MIMNTSCKTCGTTYSIIISPDEAVLLGTITDESGICKCPRLCGGHVSLTESSDITKLKDPMNLSVKDLYKAVSGMGLPDEIQTDPLVVEALLKSSKVSSVDTEVFGGRVLLHEIRMENGAVIHLSSASRGACVLKITKVGDSDARESVG